VEYRALDEPERRMKRWGQKEGNNYVDFSFTSSAVESDKATTIFVNISIDLPQIVHLL